MIGDTKGFLVLATHGLLRNDIEPSLIVLIVRQECHDTGYTLILTCSTDHNQRRIAGVSKNGSHGHDSASVHVKVHDTGINLGLQVCAGAIDGTKGSGFRICQRIDKRKVVGVECLVKDEHWKFDWVGSCTSRALDGNFDGRSDWERCRYRSRNGDRGWNGSWGC